MKRLLATTLLGITALSYSPNNNPLIYVTFHKKDYLLTSFTGFDKEAYYCRSIQYVTNPDGSKTIIATRDWQTEDNGTCDVEKGQAFGKPKIHNP